MLLIIAAKVLNIIGEFHQQRILTAHSSCDLRTVDHCCVPLCLNSKWKAIFLPTLTLSHLLSL